MAALASSAPPPTAPPALKLAEAEDDAWTDEEMAHAAALAKVVHADREHWLLGDWLAARVPVGIRGPQDGHRTHARRARRDAARRARVG